jgi:integrase
MTGHVRRRGERSWELKFDAGTDPLTGKRRIRYASFKGTKRAAEIELARLISEHASGQGVDPNKVTVGEFLTKWLADWAQQNVSPRTFEQYEGTVGRYIIGRIGGVPLQKLRPNHLQGLYAVLQRGGGSEGRPLSACSVGHAHRLLHRALGHAQTWGVIATNPASAVSPPPIPHTEVQILTEDQIGITLKYLEGRTMRPIIAFLLGTGARRAEACGLRWKDLDLDRGVVTISASLEQTKRGLRLKEPKTRHGRRSVTLSPWLVAELRAHRARQFERRMALGLGRPSDDSPVFALWDGSWRAPHVISQKWALLAEHLGFPDVTLHALRHTHVSQLIAGGADVLTVSRRIGHANPTLTLNTYGHLFRNTDQAAADLTEAMFHRVTQ